MAFLHRNALRAARGVRRYTSTQQALACIAPYPWHGLCMGYGRYSEPAGKAGGRRLSECVCRHRKRGEPLMSTTTRPQKTVLVVEDDPWIRSLMADLLKGEGYDVVQASDGKAGLEMAEENEPDVILLDLAMPEKSGLDVLHELKSSKPTRDIPVIVVSAYAMLMMGSDARRADGVIQKPFDLADLLLQVEQAAEKRRAKSAHETTG